MYKSDDHGQKLFIYSTDPIPLDFDGDGRCGLTSEQVVIACALDNWTTAKPILLHRDVKPENMRHASHRDALTAIYELDLADLEVSLASVCDSLARKRLSHTFAFSYAERGPEIRGAWAYLGTLLSSLTYEHTTLDYHARSVREGQ